MSNEVKVDTNRTIIVGEGTEVTINAEGNYVTRCTKPAPALTPVPSIPVKFIADVVNHSTRLSNADLHTLCDAVKTQLDRDCSKYWGSTADFNFGAPVSTNAKLGVFDTPDQPGALGWHDDNAGLVTIEIFYVGTLSDVGVTVSHEMLETIGDYDANTTVQGVDPNGRACTFFTENCDPVESDTYKVNGVDVSNFVTPSWFKLPSVKGTPDGRFDFLQLTQKPFEIRPGGYMEVSYDSGNTWTQIFARKMTRLSGSRKRIRDSKKIRT